MQKYLAVIYLGLAMTSCAHEPKEAEDLKVNQQLKLLGAPSEELKGCSIKVQNIITIVPSPMGPLSTQDAVCEKAMVCGEVDCTHITPDNKGVSCVPFSALQSSKSE